MKIKVSHIRDILFFLFLCSLYNKIMISIPFFIICSIVLLYHLLKRKEKIINNCSIWYIAVIIFFLVRIIRGDVFSGYMEYVKFDIIRMLECLLIILWISKFAKTKEDINKYLKMFVFLMLYITTKLVLFTPRNLWGTYRLGETINMQPTMLGLSMAFGTISAYYISKEEKNKLYLILVVIYMIISMLSGSRMGLIILLVGVSGYFVISTKGERFIRNFFIVIFFIILVYIAIMNIQPLYNTIGIRFEKSISSDKMEQSIMERQALREGAKRVFKEKPILGTGTEGFRVYSNAVKLVRETYTHNNYLEMLANYGIVGRIMYYLFIIYLFIKIFQVYKNNKALCLALIILLMILISDYGYVSYYGMFQQYFIIVAYLIYKNYRKDKNLLESGGEKNE